jgi:ribose-phosphate pyrophosphokinase
MTEMQKNMALFSGSVNPKLAEEIADELGVSLGNIKLEAFANGEIYARYLESLRGADVFIVQSVCSGTDGFDVNDALMELLIMLDAAKRASARRISAVITHYGYARQDRKAAPREPITAKLVADLLTTAGADDIIAIDLHQDAIQGFFDSPVNHMTAMPIFVDYFKQMGFDSNELCVVSPDVGRAKAAKKFSTLLDCDLAIMHKDRPKHNQAEITALIGDVEGKICILNDDMIDTAGSLVAAASTLQAKGAKKIYACATHGLFSGAAYERIENSCIEQVVVTNAVPVPEERQTGKIKVLTLAPLFAETIKNVYENGSVAKLFE